MTPKTRTRLSPEVRKRQLLATAETIIVGEGLQNFSMEALARSADVSSPLIYNYFSSRQALLQALLQQRYESYISRLNDAVADAQNFESIIRAFIHSNFVDHASGKILAVLESQPEIASVIAERKEQHGLAIARFLIENTATTYKLTPTQANLVVSMSSGASKAAADYAARSGKLETPLQTVDQALTFVMAGIETIARQREK